MIEQAIIDSIREANSIIEVIGSYIPLKKSGNVYKTNCPFHDEDTPSFVVSEQKQIFKCFGCGKAGNVLTFVRDYEKISFFEALKKLAQRAGISLPQEHTSSQKATKHELLYQTYELTAKFYQDNLWKFGQDAQEYLLNRQISKETAVAFGLGYALDSFNSLKNYLLRSHCEPALLSESGLFGKSEKGLFDAFRDRLMFPIHNSQGRVVAFGGRILQDAGNSAKYINSPTSVIYTKGEELYGLNLTRYEIARRQNALLVEGYMDFLRIYDKGLAYAVASLGTSLTPKQVALLKRYTPTVTMLYDGDNAGRKAAFRAGGELVKKGLEAKIAFLPESEDPDSFLLKYGVKALEEIIEQAEDFFSALAKDKTQGLSPLQKIDNLIAVLNELDDSVLQELQTQRVASAFGVSSASLFTKLKKTYKAPIKTTSFLEKNKEERLLLTLILQNPKMIKNVVGEISSDYFFSEELKRLYLALVELPEGIPAEAILEYFTGAMQDLVGELVLNELPGYSETESILPLEQRALSSMLEDCLVQLRTRKLAHDLAMLNAAIKKNPAELQLYSKKSEIKKEINVLTKKVTFKA